MKRGSVFALLTTLAFAFSGCASPAARYDAEAARMGIVHEVLRGEGFDHTVYKNGAAGSSARLHIYLESDGTPWRRETHISTDPTPSEPIALRLLRLDTAPAVLLGRPCYHGYARAPGCEPELWTQARYSERVVASMNAAALALAHRMQAQELVLIGYSGGGALAMLMAERLGEVAAVLTVSGNLDLGGWARLHGYTPLGSSLDPALRPPLPAHIAQLHYAGARDRNVPVHLITPVVARQPNAKLHVLPQADHACCWVAEWPALLNAIPFEQAHFRR